MVFVFGSIYVIHYFFGFVSVESALHSWDEVYLVMMDKLLMCCWIWFASILLKIFTSMLIMDTGLKFSFLIVSLPGFGIKMMLVS